MTAPVLLLAAALAASGPDAPPQAPAAMTTAAPQQQAAAPEAATTPTAPAQGPDIELHVPRAEVGKLALDVENLQARLDVDTAVAKLVHINAGVVATVQKLKMQLEQVQAETHLVVRLERVAAIMDRALATVDTHPDLAAGGEAAAAPAAALPSVSAGADTVAQPLPVPAAPLAAPPAAAPGAANTR